MAQEGVKVVESFSAEVIKADTAPQVRVINILPIHGEPITVILPLGTVVTIDGKTA